MRQVVRVGPNELRVHHYPVRFIRENVLTWLGPFTETEKADFIKMARRETFKVLSNERAKIHGKNKARRIYGDDLPLSWPFAQMAD